MVDDYLILPPSWIIVAPHHVFMKLLSFRIHHTFSVVASFETVLISSLAIDPGYKLALNLTKDGLQILLLILTEVK